jgi:hypothetical protein
MTYFPIVILLLVRIFHCIPQTVPWPPGALQTEKAWESLTYTITHLNLHLWLLLRLVVMKKRDLNDTGLIF